MLPILVLLVASSALAAPGAIQISQISSNAPSRANSLIDRVHDSFDGGEVNIYELNIGTILRDRSRRGGNQALANGQSVAYLGEIASGRVGDACAAANYINAYTKYVATGNPAGVREALGSYVQVLNSNIDNIVALATNKESVKYRTGSRGGCPGEGRTYQFEPAWDIILGSASPSEQSLTSEQYCVAKRLYCAFTALSNNVGAQVTASALPLSTQVFELVSGPLASFLSNVAARNNLPQSASSLQQALSSAVGRVSI